MEVENVLDRRNSMFKDPKVRERENDRLKALQVGLEQKVQGTRKQDLNY